MRGGPDALVQRPRPRPRGELRQIPKAPKLIAADREDQARSLCTSTARAHDLRVSSTYAPIRIDAQRFEVGMRTRDAAGMAERRCIANVATNRARII